MELIKLTILNKKFDFTGWVKLHSIGKGGFGEVCLAKLKDEKTLIAVKQIDLDQFKTLETELLQREIDNIVKEVEILVKLDSTSILKYIYHLKNYKFLIISAYKI